MSYRVIRFVVSAAGSMMLFSMAIAHAQNTQVQGTVAWADQDSGAQVCSFSQPVKGGCSGSWNIGWGWGDGKTSGVARYGTLKGHNLSQVSASQDTEAVNTNSVLTSSFSDVLSFPDLPNGTTAVLSATTNVVGSSFIGSPPSYDVVQTTVSLSNNASHCEVEGVGNCTATLTVVGGTGPVSFQLTLNLQAVGVAPCCFSFQTNMAENLGYQAIIKSLSLTGTDGQQYKIATASHHRYRSQ